MSFQIKSLGLILLFGIASSAAMADTDVVATLNAALAAKGIMVTLSWLRLSEQIFRIDKWSLCRG
jgi:hypothetical protein